MTELEKNTCVKLQLVDIDKEPPINGDRAAAVRSGLLSNSGMNPFCELVNQSTLVRISKTSSPTEAVC